MSARTAIASVLPQTIVSVVSRFMRKASESGNFSVLFTYTKMFKYSFHRQTNWKMIAQTMTGIDSGSSTRSKICNELQPSIVAALSSSTGKFRINCTNKNIKNEYVANMDGTMIGKYELPQPN